MKMKIQNAIICMTLFRENLYQHMHTLSRKRSQMNNLCLHLKKLEKEQIKLKLSRKKK